MVAFAKGVLFLFQNPNTPNGTPHHRASGEDSVAGKNLPYYSRALKHPVVCPLPAAPDRIIEFHPLDYRTSPCTPRNALEW
jgi:hypothetical protein